MKSLQITQPYKLETSEIQKPEIKPDQVLLKIKYVGFCGSDLNSYLGKNPMVNYPVIPGHEISAIIEKVGDDVPKHISLQALCTVNPYTNCGQCASCRNNKPYACKYNQTLGVQRNGAMAEYIALPWQKVILADQLNSISLALVEPMSVGFHAVERAQVTDSDTVLVIGSGMIGVGAIVRSALRGAKVIAMDIDDHKLELAKKLGAIEIINSKTENVSDRLKEITQDFGPDVVIEAVGAPATYQMAIQEVAFTGRVVFIGYAKSEISFETKLFVQKELNILGSRNATPKDFEAVISYLSKGNCPINELISKTIKPEEAEEAMKYWAENPGEIFRILVEF